ncbi:MAG: crossover junction endodeoxyribonuclease RuvC [Treponema sp.]|nr:crossover junction endodeoxyribonuclease RuvC [Candidatus Treponema equifaecale]
MEVRRIIGIDPGLAHTGFGIIDALGNKIKLVSYGVIETPSDEEHGTRLLAIYNRLQAVLMEFKPQQSAMEELFFAKNVSSALGVAEAKGVVTMCLAQNVIPLCQYKPAQIKYSVTGTRSADKSTVQQYVKILLNLEVEPKPDHAADALAAAITHVFSTAGMDYEI